MTDENIKQRIADIGQGLQAIQSGWPFLLGEINSRIDELTTSLVNNNDEQTRGRIKALIAIKELPLSCLLYTSPSPRDRTRSRMPSSA